MEKTEKTEKTLKPRSIDERRYKIIEFSRRVFERGIAREVIIAILKNMPEDCLLCGIHQDYEFRTSALVIYSERFDPVPTGSRPDAVYGEIKYIEETGEISVELTWE